MESVDFVHGHCPVCLDSLDFVQTVHWVHGQCPLNQWTLSDLAGYSGLCPWTHWLCPDLEGPWTLTVQTGNWVHGKCPLSPWYKSRGSIESMTFYRQETTTKLFCTVILNARQVRKLVAVKLHSTGKKGKLMAMKIRWFTVCSTNGVDPEYASSSAPSDLDLHCLASSSVSRFLFLLSFFLGI